MPKFTALRASRKTKGSSESVGEMVKTGGHMILLEDTAFNVEFHNTRKYSHEKDREEQS